MPSRAGPALERRPRARGTQQLASIEQLPSIDSIERLANIEQLQSSWRSRILGLSASAGQQPFANSVVE